MAKELQIPTYVLFDLDADNEDRKNDHSADNKRLLKVLIGDDSDFWSQSDISGRDHTAWSSNLGTTVSQELGSDFEKYVEKARVEFGQAKGLEKNPLVIARALEIAWEASCRSEKLQNLVSRILDFADNS